MTQLKPRTRAYNYLMTELRHSKVLSSLTKELAYMPLIQGKQMILFYAREKPLHMWWAEFEKRLTRALNAYVRRKGRIVHSDAMKIQTLLDKIKSDFLTPTKAN